MNLLAAVRPHSRLQTFAYIVSCSILMGLLARVAIPLPFTSVPVTGQTLGVLLAGLLLGPGAAAAAMILYLAQGAAGLPVFAPTGPAGIAHFFGPTAGFLLSYPLAAFATGYLARRRAWLGILAGEAVIFTIGAGWLAAITRQPASAILAAAVLPFIPGEVLKIGAALGVARFLRPARG